MKGQQILADIAASSKLVFNTATADGVKHGRKYLRRTLRGRRAVEWYPLDTKLMFPRSFEHPQIMSIYRQRELSDRLGEQTEKPKLKPLRPEFVERIKAIDAAAEMANTEAELFVFDDTEHTVSHLMEASGVTEDDLVILSDDEPEANKVEETEVEAPEG